MQVKSFSNTVKDVDIKGRTVVGYFSVFGNVDSDGDIIQKGAFAKTISENGPGAKNKIWHLIDHYFALSHAIAKPKVLIEDEKGLRFETTFPETALANDILKLYESGHITDHSIGFNVVNRMQNQNGDDEISVLTELKLYEGSSVVLASNPLANFEGIKGINDINRMIESGNNIMRNGTITDEAFKALQKKIDHLTALIEKSAAIPPTEPGIKQATTQEVINIFTQKLKLSKNGNETNRRTG